MDQSFAKVWSPSFLSNSYRYKVDWLIKTNNYVNSQLNCKYFHFPIGKSCVVFNTVILKYIKIFNMWTIRIKGICAYFLSKSFEKKACIGPWPRMTKPFTIGN